MTKTAQRYHTDGPIVSSDEAATACIHQLRLAAMFCEPAIDDDERGAERLLAELNRQMMDGDKGGDVDHPAYRAAMAFIKELEAYYARLGEEYP